MLLPEREWPGPKRPSPRLKEALAALQKKQEGSRGEAKRGEAEIGGLKGVEAIEAKETKKEESKKEDEKKEDEKKREVSPAKRNLLVVRTEEGRSGARGAEDSEEVEAIILES